MSTLATLLWKDLRRAWRNPAGWLVFLAIPMVITALIGLAFGPKSAASGGLGRIHFALVDEDDSPLTRFLRGALNQPGGATNLDVVFLTRAEALRQVRDNRLCALVVIPAGFTRNYLVSTNVVHLELIKNPAQSIHPAVLEELLGAVVTGLDAIKRNFGPDLQAGQEMFEGGRNDYHRVAELIVRVGDQVQAARDILWPPRVTYTRRTADANADATAGPAGQNGNAAPKKAPAPTFNIFSYILPGMAAMFLLFLAENASRDVQREIQFRTLDRFRTLRHPLYGFVASKAVFCLVLLFFSSAVMLGGGGLIFGIHWRNPTALIVLTSSYCLFAGGLMLLLPTMVRDRRSSQVVANVAAMFIGMAGGSAFPAEQLPAVLREHLCPFMPNYWYIQTVRSTLFSDHPAGWFGVAAGTALLGAALMAAAAVMLRRCLARGAGG